MRVRVAGLDIDVVVDPTLDGFGEFDARERCIRLADGMHPSVAASTLLHEVLHAIDDAMGIRLGERGVRAIEAGLVGCLRHDPRGARLWIEGLLVGAEGGGLGCGG